MGSFSNTFQHGRQSERGEDDRFFEHNGWSHSPRLVQWMVTGECPLNCPHCLAGTGVGVQGLLWDEAVSLVEQVAELKVAELLLTGGEPLARPDLPQILKLLAAQRVNWSLNTALMPTPRQQAAIEKWPPGFVAVSLDGPPAIHDRFRGVAGTCDRALQSLHYFSELIPGRVAAGTTVTTVNFSHLPETFGLVLESGASSWGLHLLVPEGRAAQHPELQLSRRQLRQLLKFAAAKRNQFPVTMADEIGYCGYWEPLVREAPFYCGAGRLQCVVRPDGEVVPCTTADITTSAGNLRHHSLRDIWEHGFAELRQWQPSGRCARCAYASACGGGCWLQRRHGTECFRDVWHMPQALARTGAVVCLGLATTAATAQTTSLRSVSPSPYSASDTQDDRQMEVLQNAIIQWYASELGGRAVMSSSQIETSLRTAVPEDPGALFFLRFIHGEIPNGIEPLADEIDAALKTSQRSLCLIALLWRAVTDRCLDGGAPDRRTPAEKAALRRALTAIGTTAQAWRKEIFEQKLDPFLRRPSDYRHFLSTKAGPSPAARIASKLSETRRWTDTNITNAFLVAHPYAGNLNLKLVTSAELFALRGGQRESANGEFGVFDLLLVPSGGETPTISLESSTVTVSLKLPTGTELAYGDLLRLAYEQNREKLDARIQLTGETLPLRLPALREKLRALDALPPDAPASSDRIAVKWQLVDLYLF